jgi:undecaprenyl pyrophosphate phosphatase UppP
LIPWLIAGWLDDFAELVPVSSSHFVPGHLPGFKPAAQRFAVYLQLGAHLGGGQQLLVLVGFHRFASVLCLEPIVDECGMMRKYAA